MNSFKESRFNFAEQTGFYRGKVRDVYYFGDLMGVVASDRISAFDVVLPEPIPYKGAILNTIAAKFLKATADIVPNWLIETPDPNVSWGYKAEPYKVEMVVRGYLAGHAWREYAAGKRQVCGVALPDGLKENDRLPHHIITPTTKAAEGHDEDISAEDIISKGIVAEAEYRQLEKYTLALYQRGTEMAANQGLILVDTKYEFGNRNGEIILIDEIHTPDSSRYFYAEGYEDRQKAGDPQKQLSKEFVRKWLIENNFQGKEGQSVPFMSEEKILEISNRYIELYENITGEKFEKPASGEQILMRIEANIRRMIAKFELH